MCETALKEIKIEWIKSSTFILFQKMVTPAQMRSRLSSAKHLTAGTALTNSSILWKNFLNHLDISIYLPDVCFSTVCVKLKNPTAKMISK